MLFSQWCAASPLRLGWGRLPRGPLLIGLARRRGIALSGIQHDSTRTLSQARLEPLTWKVSLTSSQGAYVPGPGPGSMCSKAPA